MLLFGYIITSCASPFTVFGNWSESYPQDEVNFFIHENIPKLESQISKYVTYNENFNPASIPEELLNKNYSYEAGLINLSLNYRHYHPKSVILNSRRNTKASYNNFLISEPENITTTYPSFQPKLLSAIFNTSNTDNFEILRNTISNFSNFIINNISKYEFNQEILKEFEKNTNTPKPLISVNGNINGFDQHQTVSNIFSEHRFTKVAKQINFTEDEIKELQNTTQYKNAPYYVPLLRSGSGALLRDIVVTSHHDKFSSKINATAFGGNIFYVRKNLCKVQIFVKIGDVGSMKLLEKALDELNLPAPICIDVFPIFRASNQTERRIVIAFEVLKNQYSPRQAVKYLYDGLINGYRNTYESIEKVITWEELETGLYPGNTIFNDLSSLSNYITKHGINETILFINGCPSFVKPLWSALEFALFYTEPFIRSLAERGRLDNITQIDEILPEESLKIDKLNLTALRAPKKFADILSLGINEQIEVTQTLFNSMRNSFHYFEDLNANSEFEIGLNNIQTSNEIEHRNLENKTKVGNYLPVFVFQKNCYQNKSYTYINKTHAIEELVGDSVMMVGGELFDHILELSEVDFTLRYFNYTVNNFSVQTEKDFYRFLFIVSQMKSKSYRGSFKDIRSPQFVIKDGNGPIKIEYKTNLIDPKLPIALDLLNRLIKSNVAMVSIYLTVRNMNATIIPQHLCRSYKSNLDGPIEIKSKDYSLILPPNFLHQNMGEYHLITGISKAGFAFGASKIEIGGRSMSVQKNGWFVTALPIGLHKALGLIERFKVDSFSSKPDIYRPCEFNKIYEIDNRLHVFSFITGQKYEAHILTMMHTLTKHCTVDVKFHIIGNFHRKVPKSYDIEFLPFLFPSDIPPPVDFIPRLKLIKLIGLEYLFPLNVQKILFSDPGVVWIGDAGRFMRLKLGRAAWALPEISNDKNRVRNLYFMQEDYVKQRAGRPFHTTNVFFVDLKQWRDRSFGQHIRTTYSALVRSSSSMNSIDNDVAGIAQLRIQTMTLPSRTAMCDIYSNPKDVSIDSSDVLSVVLCSRTSTNNIPNIREIVIESISVE